MQASDHVTFFLGANSPQGFRSVYDQFFPPEKARRIYLIKSGPGSGKSSLMRRVAQRLEDAGEAVEYIACSGDPDSLDAIAAPGLGCAVFDATAPHVMEPRYPGVSDCYLSLQDCYDKAGLEERREELLHAMDGYSEHYQRAYRCLGAAAAIRADIRAALNTPELEAKMLRRVRGILSRECRANGAQEGGQSLRFLSGFTCQGTLCRFGTVDAMCTRVYELSDSYGLGHPMLQALAAGARAAGYDIIACPSPLFPDRLEHLIIPRLSLAFVTSGPDSAYGRRPYRRIRLDAMVDQELLRHCRGRLRFSQKIALALIREAQDSMAAAKGMHDRLEELYHPYIDFEQVNSIADRVAEEFLAMA